MRYVKANIDIAALKISERLVRIIYTYIHPKRTIGIRYGKFNELSSGIALKKVVRERLI
jgi:hypothetical protein